MTQRNIRLCIAFDGTGYSGWQRQSKDSTIQGTIENSLSVMTQSPVTLHGAGRTDAGVHAHGMIANFHTDSSVPCPGIQKGLNSMLPSNIRILKVQEVPSDFHSRFDATGKTYRYDIFTGKVQLPTERLYIVHFPCKLDTDKIKMCLKYIEGTHDFTSFEGSGSRDTSVLSGRGAVRTLFKTCFTPVPTKNETWSFHFTGDGFLRHMVRNLVGTLIEVGKEKKTPDDFISILQKRDRRLAGPTAPAHGLVLEKVFYEPIP